ncbi:type II toxin-antitoxin system VapC family toxin [Xanthobacter sediminis]
MILADTSVWIDHFRHSSAALRAVIENDALLCHPAIIGELALGSLRDRQTVLSFLNTQRKVTVATHDEVMGMVDHCELFSMGIGYTDAHLLASTLIDSRAELWTNDKRLQAAAQKANAQLFRPTAQPS